MRLIAYSKNERLLRVYLSLMRHRAQSALRVGCSLLLCCAVEGRSEWDAHSIAARSRTLVHEALSIDPATARPTFMGWYSENDTYRHTAATNPSRFPYEPIASRQPVDVHGASAAPLITWIHFNADAHHRLRRQRSPTEPSAANTAMPETARIALSAWWPLAADRISVIPVWRSGATQRVHGSNSYLNWPEVAAISHASTPPHDLTLSFAGRHLRTRHSIERNELTTVTLNAAQAESLMASSRFKKASLIALGREMREGDAIALIAIHVVSFARVTGEWATGWFDPQYNVTPERLQPIKYWQTDGCIDAEWPHEPDGSSAICFNPWFDATFTDTGGGNGTKANCLGCHQLAGTGKEPQVRHGSSPILENRQGSELIWSATKNTYSAVDADQ